MNTNETKNKFNDDRYRKFLREFSDWLATEFVAGRDGSVVVAVDKAPSIQAIGIQWLEKFGHLHHTLENGICEWMNKDWPEIPKDNHSPQGPLYGKIENLFVWAPGGGIIINKTMTEAEAIEQAEAEWASVFDDEPEEFKWLAYTTCFDDGCWFRHAKLSDADQKKYMAIAVKALKVMNHSQILQDILTGELEITDWVRSTESELRSFSQPT